MKVLIIDDDADIRFVAAMSLRAGGAIDVVEASGGLDGVCNAARNSRTSFSST